MLDFAHEEGLHGINIHIDGGDTRSLRNMSKKDLKKVKSHADKLKLGINLEVSSTTKEDIAAVVRIAKVLDVKNIRVYIRRKSKRPDKT